jgi:integrase
MFPLHVAWETGPPEARHDPTRAEYPTAFPQQQPQEYAHANGMEQYVGRERGERDTGIRQGKYWHYLASRGHDTRAIQDYLGHKNIQHTVRYTAMAPHRFESFWND